MSKSPASQPMRTPTKTAAGLGAAKSGGEHFIQQRVSAIALVVLVPWFMIALIAAYRTGYEGAVAWVAQPWTAIPLILAVSAAFFHMRLGMQTVIEDYIAKHGSKAALLILNTFAVLTLWLISVLSIVKIFVGA